MCYVYLQLLELQKTQREVLQQNELHTNRQNLAAHERIRRSKSGGRERGVIFIRTTPGCWVIVDILNGPVFKTTVLNLPILCIQTQSEHTGKNSEVHFFHKLIPFCQGKEIPATKK